MSEFAQPSRSRQDDPAPDDDPIEAAGQVQARTASIDSLLDEIDSVLETNAEAFVQGFVQKGGQ